jgi:hypothetical protein
MIDMHALKARVENGRYVIDEPAALPEGAAITDLRGVADEPATT